MTKAEAIETLRANYPDACYEQLRDAVDTAIEVLQAQDATGGTISRRAAIAEFKPYALYDSNLTNAEWVRRIELVLEQLPSAEKHGKWESKALDNFRKYEVVCSECGARYVGNYDAYDEPYDFNYCPNCGARMEESDGTL